jgi:uncharacterized protein
MYRVFLLTAGIVCFSCSQTNRGEVGAPGLNGTPGANGAPGLSGTPGANGNDGARGANGTNAIDVLPENTPLSGVVAVSADEPLPSLVRDLVQKFERGTLSNGTQFPLPAATTDSVRSLRETRTNVVVKWFDPLSYTAEVMASDGGVTTTRDPRRIPRFGANPDFVAFFGDGWEVNGTPLFQGSSASGWMWVNHEYVSNDRPYAAALPDGGIRFFPPSGQHLSLARFSKALQLVDIDSNASNWQQADFDAHIKQWKRHVGGSWIRIVKDDATGSWQVDLSAPARRFDATSATLLSITGHQLAGLDRDDMGMPLPSNVTAGTHSNCAGGVTPWGTILSGEENTQSGYGDLEPLYSTTNLYLTSGHGFAAGGPIQFSYAPVSADQFSASPGEGAFASSAEGHSREVHGWLTEFDPTQRPSAWYGANDAGTGHRRLGVMGRARWEAGAIAVNRDWHLPSGQSITVYGADDRRNGRIYKFVSSAPYLEGMSKAQTRALLDREGKLYVAHFENLQFDDGEVLTDGGVPQLTRTGDGGLTIASPGSGRWIHLALTSTDIAPNAMALGLPSMTVGQALASSSWNGVGAFTSEDDVRRALHTAANKIGIAELNRPEDVEWNPVDPTGTPALYVAFTGHGQPTTLTQAGVMADGGATQGSRAGKRSGSIFAIREAGDPSSSTTFTFYSIWRGTSGSSDVFAAAMPDNLLIDRQGGLWFGTDGNPGRNNGKSDAIYYLDLDSTHSRSFGKAFRVVAVPSDAEATGPAFTPDMRTLFLSVQHPGEDQVSTWPRRSP